MIPTKDTTLTVNLAGERLRPPLWFLKLYPGLLGDEKLEEARFGDDWNAPIVFRWPTIDDHTAIAGQLNVYAQSRGFEQAGHLPDLTFLLAQALFFFEHLKGTGATLPAWLARDVPATPRQQLAILRAHDLALALLADEKKSSKPSGSDGSTG